MLQKEALNVALPNKPQPIYAVALLKRHYNLDEEVPPSQHHNKPSVNLHLSCKRPNYHPNQILHNKRQSYLDLYLPNKRRSYKGLCLLNQPLCQKDVTKKLHNKNDVFKSEHLYTADVHHSS